MTTLWILILAVPAIDFGGDRLMRISFEFDARKRSLKIDHHQDMSCICH
ncbi:uncharacterized protein M6B38_315665 [Iris pallida]|uniref:Uncharacterized protein n=1 Tax=Iris pallida TaxID=29817 RepID=A0AAX6HE60_IRIPA|nr:uncharacterized protein M6B38_315665 [Iris pallida]